MDTTTLIVAGSVLFFALLVDGVLFGIIYATRRSVMKAANWPSTMGTVLSSNIVWRRRSNGGSVAYPSVHYSYHIMGQNHQGSKIMPGPAVGGAGTKKVVARYPAGAQVLVYYDPNDPANAVLERGMPGHIKWLWIAIISTDLFLCGLGVFLAFVV